ncbi:type VII secretion-associated serine protease mycosin [Streptomyces sodiiphilus]|uniref:Type VII secretion-associated serine protease mycosin n=1 Tax=Streptomyces sodiiphilus TaxID=226217 RepID=A0ABN2NZV1_9ACTN
MEDFRADEMWQQSQGRGITVAVIDTGVDPTAPELRGQVLEGMDFLTGEGTGQLDNDGHGTAMAALVAGTGAGGGVQGLAPEAKILPLRVANQPDGFELAAPEDNIIEAIEFAAQSDARILSIAVGNYGSATRQQAKIDAAISEASRQDKLIFVAAGNGGDGETKLPLFALQEGTIGVAATGRDGERAPYSAHGSFVGLAAPGSDIPLRCDFPSGDMCVGEGTSNASALASASAALIWSANPEWTKNQVLRVMMETADGPSKTPRNHYVGYGTVRPDRVILDGEGDPGDPDMNPMFERYEAALDPPATPEPSAGEQEEPGTSGGSDEEAGTRSAGTSAGAEDSPEERAAESGGEDRSTGGPAVLFGLAGVVIVAGGLAAWWMRRRQDTGTT